MFLTPVATQGLAPTYSPSSSRLRFDGDPSLIPSAGTFKSRMGVKSLPQCFILCSVSVETDQIIQCMNFMLVHHFNVLRHNLGRLPCGMWPLVLIEGI